MDSFLTTFVLFLVFKTESGLLCSRVGHVAIADVPALGCVASSSNKLPFASCFAGLCEDLPSLLGRLQSVLPLTLLGDWIANCKAGSRGTEFDLAQVVQASRTLKSDVLNRAWWLFAHHLKPLTCWPGLALFSSKGRWC